MPRGKDQIDGAPTHSRRAGRNRGPGWREAPDQLQLVDKSPRSYRDAIGTSRDRGHQTCKRRATRAAQEPALVQHATTTGNRRSASTRHRTQPPDDAAQRTHPREPAPQPQSCHAGPWPSPQKATTHERVRCGISHQRWQSQARHPEQRTSGQHGRRRTKRTDLPTKRRPSRDERAAASLPLRGDSPHAEPDDTAARQTPRHEDTGDGAASH